METLVAATTLKGSQVGITDRLRLLRFRAWARFLVLPVAGLELSEHPAASALALGRGLVIAFCVLGFGYLANSVGDRTMDRDPSKNPLLGGWRDDALVRRALVLLALGALLASVAGPASVRLATLICLTSGWAYSLGPRLKGVPLIGTLMNVANFAPLLYVGVGAAGAPERLGWLLPAFAALLVQNQLLHEAADAPEDRAGALRTTFLQLGQVASALLAAASGAVVLMVALRVLLRCGWSPAFALLAMPFVVLFPALLAWRGSAPAEMARLRVAQRWSAAVCGALLALLEL